MPRRWMALAVALIVAVAWPLPSAGEDAGPRLVQSVDDGDVPTFAVREIPAPSATKPLRFGTVMTTFPGSQRIIVGAPTPGTNECDPGAAYSYERTKTGWSPKGAIPSFQSQHHCGFGQSFSWAGGFLLIGAHQQPWGSGSVESFRHSSGTTLVPRYGDLHPTPDAQSSGWSLANIGSVVVVGAPAVITLYPNPPGQGRIHWYTKVDGTWERDWQRAGTVVPTDGAGGDRFGFALATSGTDLFVGAPGRAVDGIAGAGAVYHYRYTAPNMQLVRIIEPPDPAPDASFGFALARSGSHLAVGEPRCGAVSQTGCVHVYNLSDLDAPPRTWTASDGRDEDRLGESLLFAHGLLFAGAIGAGPQNGPTWAGAVYGFSIGHLEPFETLVVRSPHAGNARFGSSLMATADGLLVGAPTRSHNGQGNVGSFFALEWDGDEDGLSDRDEVNWQLTDPADNDTDDDGLVDGAEVWVHNTKPLDADSDNDMLLDGAEVHDWLTSPIDPDTDEDSLNDGREALSIGTNALVFDCDGDGLGDGVEIDTYGTDAFDKDTDGDLFSDQYEVATGSDPTDPWDLPIVGPFYDPPRLPTPLQDEFDDLEPAR